MKQFINYMTRLTFLFTFLILFPVSGFTQIEGDITDPQKKGISSAVIIVTDSSRNFSDTARTDQRGFYEFTGLQPGKYRIEAKAPGFITAVYEIIVDKDHTGALKGERDMYRGTRLNITLKPGKTTKSPG